MAGMIDHINAKLTGLPASVRQYSDGRMRCVISTAVDAEQAQSIARALEANPFRAEAYIDMEARADISTQDLDNALRQDPQVKVALESAGVSFSGIDTRDHDGLRERIFVRLIGPVTPELIELVRARSAVLVKAARPAKLVKREIEFVLQLISNWEREPEIFAAELEEHRAKLAELKAELGGA